MRKRAFFAYEVKKQVMASRGPALRPWPEWTAPRWGDSLIWNRLPRAYDPNEMVDEGRVHLRDIGPGHMAADTIRCGSRANFGGGGPRAARGAVPCLFRRAVGAQALLIVKAIVSH